MSKEQIIWCNNQIERIKSNRQTILFTLGVCGMFLITGLIEGL